MDIYKEIVQGLLEEESAGEVLSKPLRADQLVEMVSYQTLKAIKQILEDDALTDNACFLKIEAIIRRFEALGSTCGKRHNF